jgi:hypothetical protein
MSSMDDPFFDIVNMIDIKEDEICEDIVDVSKLTIEELLIKFDDINNQLFELGEALSPQTQNARDLHSMRSAIYVEIQKRKKS